MFAWSIKGHKTLNHFIFLLTITVGLNVMNCCVMFEAKARVYCAREVRIDRCMKINIGGKSN